MSQESKENDLAEDFATFLAEFGYGSVNESMSEKVREVVAACKKSGNKGSVTLKLSVHVKNDMAQIGFSIATKKPEPDLPGRILYASEDGALATSDPKQLKLPSKILNPPSRVVKIVPGPSNPDESKES